MARFEPLQKSPKFVPLRKPSGERELKLPPDRDPGGTVGQRAEGALQAGASLATTMLSVPVSGAAGILQLTLSSLNGSDDPLGDAVDRIEGTRDLFTFTPRTEVGENILRNLTSDERMESLMEQARVAGETSLEKTGSPAIATAVETAISLVPEMIGVKRGFTAVPRRGGAEEPEIGGPRPDKERADIQEEPLAKARKKDFERVQKILSKEGIDTSSKEALFDSLRRIGEEVQKPGFADSLKRVRNAVMKARRAEEDLENDLWTKARKGGEGFIAPKEMTSFRSHLNRAMEDYLVEDMPAVKRLKERFEREIDPIPGQTSAKISALYRWRKSMNKNLPPKGTADRAAMFEMRHQLDRFLQEQFMTDMVRGDPASVARWRQAIDKSADIRKLYDDELFMRRLAEEDATPEELRDFVFNASSVGMKAEASRLIQNLKKVLGEDSPEFKALRNESMFNLMEPLLKQQPDFDAFGARYLDFVKKNPSAANELFPKEARGALKALYSASKSASTRQGLIDKYGSILKAVSDIGVVSVLGHGIAQAGLKVRIAKQVLEQVIHAEATPIKKEILQDFLGYDPTISAFREPMKRAAAIGSLTQAIAENQEERREEPSAMTTPAGAP